MPEHRSRLTESRDRVRTSRGRRREVSRDDRDLPAAARLEPSARAVRQAPAHASRRREAALHPGRDPRALGDVLADLTAQPGGTRRWRSTTCSHVGRGRRRGHRAAHRAGRLRGRRADGPGDSTAWAKQLQLMRAQILSEIVRGSPERGSRRSASSGRTSPPGNGVPERFQGVVRAIPTAEAGEISVTEPAVQRLRSALLRLVATLDLIGSRAPE